LQALRTLDAQKSPTNFSTGNWALEEGTMHQSSRFADALQLVRHLLTGAVILAGIGAAIGVAAMALELGTIR
jgi:hypothetical protein